MKTIISILGTMLTAIIFILIGTVSFAQTTTITGTVYEKEQSKTTLDTKHGKITVYLPDDVASGDQITGVVIAKPKGSDERKRKKNLKELKKYSLLIPGGVLLSSLDFSSESPFDKKSPHETISFKVPKDKDFSLTIEDEKGKPISSSTIPTLPEVPIEYSSNPSNTEFTVAKRIIGNAEPLTLLGSTQVSDIPNVMLTSYKNEQYAAPIELESTIYSPRKIIYNLPSGISGHYAVCLLLDDGTLKTIDLINIVRIDASIGKGSLSKGEKTSLQLKVSGLEDCYYAPVELELINKTPSIIRMAEGNMQRFTIDQKDEPIDRINKTPFEMSQDVIGQKTGSFVINTTLRIPPSAYSNSVQSYFDNVNSPEQFNDSGKAFKDDVTSFLKEHDVSENLHGYLDKIKESIPVINNDQDIAFAKSKVVNMVNPILNTTEGDHFLAHLNNLDNQHPEIKAKNELPNQVHPIHNLAGKFNSTTNILTVNANDRIALIDYLQANQLPNGNYTFALSNGEEMVTYNDVVIDIKETLIDYCSYSPEESVGVAGVEEAGKAYGKTPGRSMDTLKNKISKAAAEAQGRKPSLTKEIEERKKGEKTKGTVKGAATGAVLGAATERKGTLKGAAEGLAKGISKATKDVAEGTSSEEKAEETSSDRKSDSSSKLATQTARFEDEKGNIYRFYKDATCKLLFPTKNNDNCYQYREPLKNDETGKTEYVFQGKYVKYIFQDYKKCVVGTGFCTEMLQIYSTQLIYEDKECKRLKEIKTVKDFYCQ
ncbi:glycine zipper family protein [Puteibacter caeruleilacunae]|nr:glycine zipper family protein [Puteibacter caeruleilacunae]